MVQKNIRLFYVPGGPGDVIGTFNQWSKGSDEVYGDVSVAFSAQFYDIVKKLNAMAYTVSPHPKKELLENGAFIIEHRPKPSLTQKGGGLFYLAELWYVLGIIKTCFRFKADIAIVADTPVWPVWMIARIIGIKIIAVLHCSLWPSGFRPKSRKHRLMFKVTGWFWERFVDATVGVSPECIRQVRMIAPKICKPMVVGFSLFRKNLFNRIPPPPVPNHPFRIMFAGRIERSKGVFDLLECAKILEQRDKDRFVWDVCGDGSALSELEESVKTLGLEKVVLLRGRLSQQQMLECYGQSHVVVVPTTSLFAEGLNQVAIEAVLAGRPVVTSRLSNALEFLHPATYEVPPDNVSAYANAIQELANNDNLYQKKQTSCINIVDRFYNPEQSWGKQIYQCIEDLVK